MSFDWNLYIALADELILTNPNEAKLRCATSRAYYGAFIPCRNFREYTKNEKDVHQKVINDFKRSDSRKGVSLGNFLDSLRNKRNDADYDGYYKPKLDETKKHISAANSILSLLETVKEEGIGFGK